MRDVDANLTFLHIHFIMNILYFPLFTTARCLGFFLMFSLG